MDTLFGDDDELRMATAATVAAVRQELEKRFTIESVGMMLRESTDHVVNGARTDRYLLDQLSKTEKSSIGTLAEQGLQDLLGVPRGRTLD